MGLPKLNVPQYQVELPSTGELINMRPYLVKEEKVLMIALESNDVGQISQAVRNIILSCYDLQSLEELTVFDIEYLFLHLRGKSVGEKMNLQAKCQDEECTGVTPIVIDINDVNIINKNLDRLITLDESTGVGVQMKYPSMEMIGSLDPERLNSIDGVMDLITKCIDTIFDNDNVYDVKNESAEEVQAFIDSLSSEQFKKIQQFFLSVPALHYESDYECVKCSKKNKLELKGLQSFFS